MSKQPIIIDCDPGQDDAVAILLALASPEEIELVAITTVAGNVSLDLTSRNARRICELAARPDIPVYVLVSAQTFSAGEWFAQSLSELGRAIIVGERTAGAAHPVGLKRVNADLVMQVPVGVIRGPVTRGDFEGRGVDPQVAVPAHDALDKAQLLALETVDARNGSQRSAWFAPWLTAPPLTDPQVQADMRAIVGAYEGRVVAREGATLVYRWRERNALTLIPLGDGLFGVEGTYDYRFRLVRSDSGVAALVREFEDGTQVTYDRKD